MEKNMRKFWNKINPLTLDSILLVFNKTLKKLEMFVEHKTEKVQEHLGVIDGLHAEIADRHEVISNTESEIERANNVSNKIRALLA